MAIIDQKFMDDLEAVQSYLWAKVDMTEYCWNWTGGKDRKGYGRFHVRAQEIMAHRASYLLEVGPIPDGMLLDHSCRNKSCVRPTHLRPATSKQNGENLDGVSTNNTSGYRGVFFDKRKKAKPWAGRIVHNRKFVHVGVFATAEEANAAVIAKRNELFTHNDLDRHGVSYGADVAIRSSAE